MRTRVWFDGHELTEHYLCSDLGRALLPRSVGTQRVGGLDGAIVTGVTLSPRTVTMTLTTVCRDMAKRQAWARRLAAALAVDEPRPLRISIDGGLWLMAVPTSSGDAARRLAATSFDVSFECTDPVFRGERRSVAVPSGGTTSFRVGGTYPASPVVTVSGAANAASGHWRLALDDGTYLLATVPEGSGGSALSFDCCARTLAVDGATALLAPEASWLVLEPGTHTLAMDGSGEATVTYEERWL